MQPLANLRVEQHHFGGLCVYFDTFLGFMGRCLLKAHVWFCQKKQVRNDFFLGHALPCERLRIAMTFRPLDMHGHARSHEASAAQCALRCKSVEGCSHFSYWSDGGCHLQDWAWSANTRLTWPWVKTRLPPVNIPIPTKIDHGWCTYPKMVPLVLNRGVLFWGGYVCPCGLQGKPIGKPQFVGSSKQQTHTQTERPTQPDRHTERGAHRHGHTDTQTHRHTDTDTQTHRHTDTQTHKHTDTQTHGHRRVTTCHLQLPRIELGMRLNRQNSGCLFGVLLTTLKRVTSKSTPFVSGPSLSCPLARKVLFEAMASHFKHRPSLMQTSR